MCDWMFCVENVVKLPEESTKLDESERKCEKCTVASRVIDGSNEGLIVDELIKQSGDGKTVIKIQIEITKE